MNSKLLLLLCLVACLFLLNIEAKPTGGKGKGSNTEAVARGKARKGPTKSKHGGAQNFPEQGRKLKEQRDAERMERVAKKPRAGNARKKQPKTKEQRDKMKAACARKPQGCTRQSSEVVARKANNRNVLLQSKRKQYKFKDRKPTADEEGQLEVEVDLIMTKIFEAKKALIKAQGFADGEVEPEDDGMWAGDQLLTVEQAERIIAYQNGNDTEDNDVNTPPPLPTPQQARRKRYARYLEGEPSAKWDEFPIKYVIEWSSQFNPTEKTKIRNAIKDIELRSCITFEEVAYRPSTPHMLFLKTDYAPFCGRSFRGRTGNENQIEINAIECSQQFRGIIAHEILHALGVDHEHIRYDRDNFVQVNYDNVDPMVTDYFEMGDGEFTTGYGTKYDYFSIMHDNAFKGGINYTVNVLTPTKEPRGFFSEVIGQRESLSEKDGDLLRKLYCSPDCDDLEVWCGWWATDGYCETSTDVMIDVCPKSCGFCPMAATQIARDNVELYYGN